MCIDHFIADAQGIGCCYSPEIDRAAVLDYGGCRNSTERGVVQDACRALRDRGCGGVGVGDIREGDCAGSGQGQSAVAADASRRDVTNSAGRRIEGQDAGIDRCAARVADGAGEDHVACAQLLDADNGCAVVGERSVHRECGAACRVLVREEELACSGCGRHEGAVTRCISEGQAASAAVDLGARKAQFLAAKGNDGVGGSLLGEQGDFSRVGTQGDAAGGAVCGDACGLVDVVHDRGRPEGQERLRRERGGINTVCRGIRRERRTVVDCGPGADQAVGLACDEDFCGGAEAGHIEVDAARDLRERGEGDCCRGGGRGDREGGRVPVDLQGSECRRVGRCSRAGVQQQGTAAHHDRRTGADRAGGRNPQRACVNSRIACIGVDGGEKLCACSLLIEPKGGGSAVGDEPRVLDDCA